MPSNPVTDDMLLESIRNRDTDALRTLFNRYEKAIYNFILKSCGNRELAQELLQETFTRIWYSAHMYRSIGKAQNWIYTIARNLSNSEMTKKRYSYHYEDICDIDSTIENQNLATKKPDAHIEQQHLKSHIAQALQRLKPELREVIIFKHFQQLKFREIAEICNTAESTLKTRYLKALSELKIPLKDLEL